MGIQESYQESICDILRSDNNPANPDSLLSLGLGFYPPGTTQSLAVFVQYPIPAVGNQAYVSIGDNISDAQFTTKMRDGGTFIFDVGIYVPSTGSITKINRLTARARALIMESDLNVIGFRTIVKSCTWGIQAPTDETITGRILTVTVTAQRAS